MPVIGNTGNNPSRNKSRNTYLNGSGMNFNSISNKIQFNSTINDSLSC